MQDALTKIIVTELVTLIRLSKLLIIDLTLILIYLSILLNIDILKRYPRTYIITRLLAFISLILVCIACFFV